ncbi:Site-specific recombinase XerD, partial [Mycoplasmopsis edwardii]
MDFHHHLKSCLLDAFDEGLLDNDPTRKVVVKGKPPRAKRQKFLSQFELQLLLKSLKLKDKLNPDWLLLLIAKTGLRFSEAIAITPEDFDFAKQTLNISKTW